MKALLTGISGNLGYEVSLDLAKRGVSLIACVRPGKTDTLLTRSIKFQQVIESDLIADDVQFYGTVDYIIHCAGIVHFREAGNKNEEMMVHVIALAHKLSAPIHFVSTAFVDRADGSDSFNNQYEQDKFNAEQLLIKSGVPHSIFRPSVLTGHSRTGEIRNFSGFYLMVRAFITASQAARARNRLLRFPRMFGESNMVPVDQAAICIGDAILNNQSGISYITNPKPPHSQWVLEETLDFFNMRGWVKILDVSFREFGDLKLTNEEATLYRVFEYFSPYWSREYAFPSSICTKNLVNHDYMVRALTFFGDSENLGGKSTY